MARRPREAKYSKAGKRVTLAANRPTQTLQQSNGTFERCPFSIHGLADCLGWPCALDWMGYSGKFWARIWCDDSWSAGDARRRAPFRTKRLASKGRFLRFLWRAGLVFRREHLVYASQSLYPLRSFG